MAQSAFKAAMSGMLFLASAGPAFAGPQFPLIDLPAPHALVSTPQPASASDKGCRSVADVAGELKVDEKMVGGKTIALTGGLEQAFSDAWRRQTGGHTVPVTLVVGHAFADPRSGDLFVDTVEFGNGGCAISRTVLPVGAWNTILRSAVGITV